MGKHVAIEIVKLMIKKGLKVNDSRALILGITFKENCPDIRNTKVIDIYNELLTFGINIDVYDPNANIEDVINEHGITLITELNNEALSEYSSIIIAVAHNEFLNLKLKKNKTTVVYDLKGILPQTDIDARL
jgi:UDP-N-acetyl-D-galactosamine dehydrogenase